MAAWRPGYWYCYSMPVGGTYNIDTRRHGGLAAWLLELLLDAGRWHIHHRHGRHGGVAAWLLVLLLDAGGWHVHHRHGRHGGVAAWLLVLLLDADRWHVHHRHAQIWRRGGLATWYCYSMPAGGTYTIDSADMAAWQPSYWHCYSMPVGAVTISAASDFAGWVSTTTIRANDNGLLQAAVDKILSGCWSAFATRTATGGTINVGGTNAAPSGVLQAANPPTTGKEFAYEFANDSKISTPRKNGRLSPSPHRRSR